MLPTTKFPGTPPEPDSDAYSEQVAQMKSIIGRGATNKEEAERLAVMLFVPDMSYHRGAISQALTELERAFQS